MAEEFETRRTIIRVKDAEPVTITLRRTDSGPVLPGSHYDMGTVTPGGHVMSLSWSALGAPDTSMTAAIRLMTRSRAEAIEAGKLVMAPAQNLMLADKDGIAMQVIGALPKRDARHQTQGRMPAPGWLPENRWQGQLRYGAFT